MLAAGTGYSHGHVNPQILRYRVFSDLWRRGYYLTPGLKYSGDYLVYAGMYESEKEYVCSFVFDTSLLALLSYSS